jgi:hypothetical protein
MMTRVSDLERQEGRRDLVDRLLEFELGLRVGDDAAAGLHGRYAVA